MTIESGEYFEKPEAIIDPEIAGVPHFIILTGLNGDGTEYCPECTEAQQNLALLDIPVRRVHMPVGRKGVDEKADNTGGRQGLLAQDAPSIWGELEHFIEQGLATGDGNNLPVPLLIFIDKKGVRHGLGYVGEEANRRTILGGLELED